MKYKWFIYKMWGGYGVTKQCENNPVFSVNLRYYRGGVYVLCHDHIHAAMYSKKPAMKHAENMNAQKVTEMGVTA